MKRWLGGGAVALPAVADFLDMIRFHVTLPEQPRVSGESP